MPPLSQMIDSEIRKAAEAFSASKERETYDPARFGDAQVILRGPQVSVRFVRERGKIFLDLRGNSGDWVDANDVLAKLGVYPSVKPPVPIAELVALVCSNSDAITKMI